MLTWLKRDDLSFPPLETALREPNGLLAAGGDLRPERLLAAYRHGCFPWYQQGQPLLWWSPDPRAIFELEGFHVSRRLARTCRSGTFQVTCDQDFRGVIEGCATADDRRYNTWLTPPMIAAYTQLFELGHAHSIEVRQDGTLVGGTYGIAIGGLFAGESMFHRVRDASKVALVYLVSHLRARGYQLFDIQQKTSHTASLGAIEIPRDEYLRRLAVALNAHVSFGERLQADSVHA